MIPSEYFVPWLVSNIVSVLLIVAAARWPRVTRWIFVSIFLLAGLFNLYTGLVTPELYLSYGPTATLPIYHRFIAGEFGRYITAYVVAIAAGQIVVAALLTRSGWLFRLGVIGGVVFFLAITPLGIGAAFPATLLMAAALLLSACRAGREATGERPSEIGAPSM